MASKTKLMEMYIEVKAKQDKAEKQLKTLEKTVANKSKKMGSLFSKGFILKLGGFTGGMVLLKKGFDSVRNSVSLAIKQAQAFTKVESAVKSTGGAAGFSAKELGKMAVEMQKITGIGDEAILSKVQAQLLTFTNIQGDAFSRLQNAVLDVNQVINDGNLSSLTSMSIQLGKALNDPISNLGALGRSGIQFTQVQKDMIKELAATNRLADAQAIILNELEKQYGGQAEAANKASGNIANLSSSFGDLQERIAAGILPIIGKIAPLFSRFFDSLLPGKTNLESVTDAAHTQRIEFETLASKYEILSQKQNKSKSEITAYQGVIKELNSKYGEYLGNIDLEKTAYEDVAVAIDKARGALLEKTRIMAIEAEFADKQAEIVSLQRDQLTAIESAANATAKLNLLGVETNELTKEQLADLVKQGTIQSSFKTDYTETAKLARSLLGARAQESIVLTEISTKQQEINSFMERNNEALIVSAESNDRNKTAVENTTKSLKEATEEVKKTESFVRKIPKELQQMDDGVINIVNSADLMPGPFKKVLEDTKEEKKELSEVEKTISSINTDFNAGIVNGLTDAILKTKTWGEALGEVGKRIADLAIGQALDFGLSLIPGGGIIGGLGKLLGFSEGGSLSFAGNVPRVEPIKAASGLSGMVPPGYPNDSFIVPVAMTSGERFTVETQQQQSTSSTNNISMSFNVSTTNPVDFERYLKTDGRAAIEGVLSDINVRGH